MKKVFAIFLSMVMALTMVLGLSGTAAARPATPNDDGLYRFGVNYYYIDGERYFLDILDFVDNSVYSDAASIEVADPGPFGYFEYPFENYELYWLDFSGEIITQINWGKGIATFQSEKFELTITFDPRNVDRNTDVLNGVITTSYSGEVSFSGTVTLNSGEPGTIPQTTVSANLLEAHTFPKPVK